MPVPLVPNVFPGGKTAPHEKQGNESLDNTILPQDAPLNRVNPKPLFPDFNNNPYSNEPLPELVDVIDPNATSVSTVALNGTTRQSSSGKLRSKESWGCFINTLVISLSLIHI